MSDSTKARLRLGGPLFCLLAAGCSGVTAWMPMRQGRSWNFLVRESQRVVQVRCVGSVRVGLHDGWLVSGDGGSNKLAWVGGELLASEVSAMRFEPPIVLLKPQTEKAQWAYHGRSMSRARTAPFSATLSQESATLRVGGFDRKTLLVTLRGKFGDIGIEFKTWYERGEGVLRQEQRNNGELVAAMELVSGK